MGTSGRSLTERVQMSPVRLCLPANTKSRELMLVVFESKINLTLNLGITFQFLFCSLGYLSGNQKKAFLGALWGCISMYKPIRSYTTKYPIVSNT